MLRCNVVIPEEGDRTIVQALDPEAMVEISGNVGLQEVAREASVRVRQAIISLANPQPKTGGHDHMNRLRSRLLAIQSHRTVSAAAAVI